MSDRPQRTNTYTADPISDRYRECLFDWLAAHAPFWNQLTYRRRQQYFSDDGDVWDAFWHVVVPDTVETFPDDGYVPQADDDLPDGVVQADIPISPKYFAGGRSLGSEVSTEKTTDDPAWLQNLDDTTERAGRAQDKEDLTERLRDLGYM